MFLKVNNVLEIPYCLNHRSIYCIFYIDNDSDVRNCCDDHNVYTLCYHNVGILRLLTSAIYVSFHNITYCLLNFEC